MATGMSSGSLAGATEQFQAVDPGSRTRLQLHSAPPPVTLPPFKWSPFGTVRFGGPGKLSAYPSRVEHARAHRLAAERARRNRRCVRKGRAEPGGLQSTRTVTWTMSVDLGGFMAAMEGVGVAMRRFGESVTSIVQAQVERFDLSRLNGLYAGGRITPPRDPDDDSVPVVLSRGYGAWIPAETWDRCTASELTSAVLGSGPDLTHYDRDLMHHDATSSADSLDCSSSNGARWSDLMSRIDDLTSDAS